MEKLASALNEIVKTGKGKSILLELDTRSYFEANVKTIKQLQKKGFRGVYVSVQRPFRNVSSLLEKQGVDLDQIIFIDIASAVSAETPEKSPGCVHISPKLDVDELVKAIYTALETITNKRTGQKKREQFIFIDSLTTLALHQPISETLRLSEFLMREVKNEKNMVLLLNVAKDLSHKEFIQDVVVQADQTIEV